MAKLTLFTADEMRNREKRRKTSLGDEHEPGIAKFEALLVGARPGWRGEIEIEPDTDRKMMKQMLKEAGRRHGLDIGFRSSPDPDRLVAVVLYSMRPPQQD